MTDREKTPGGEIVLYEAPDGTVSLDVRLERDSLWISQNKMALLFDKDTDTVGLHLGNIFEEGKLQESATTEESSVVQMEGKWWVCLVPLTLMITKSRPAGKDVFTRIVTHLLSEQIEA